MKLSILVAAAVLLGGCALFEPSEEIDIPDSGTTDATVDTGPADVGTTDADVPSDAGDDAAATDAGDAGLADAADADATADAGRDADEVENVVFGNQPPGHTIITENDFAGVPDGPGSSPSVGFWDLQPFATTPDMEAVADPDAYVSGPDVVRIRMPAGLPTYGREWYVEAWKSGFPTFREIYGSFFIKLEGNDWENDANGTLLVFFSFSKDNQRNVERRLHLEISPKIGRASSFTMRVRIEEWPGMYLEVFDSNLDATERLTVGEWHQIEIRSRLNTSGESDGDIALWIDSHPVMHHTGLELAPPSVEPLFFYFILFNEWLGPGTARDTEDSWLIDHARLTGGP